MKAGYAKVSIDPGGPLELAGMYTKSPRIGRKRRDGLYARAVALQHRETRIVLVAADLLCISKELYASLREATAELKRTDVLLSATHTHSSFGGYFMSESAAPMLGSPNREIFETLVLRLKQVVVDALQDAVPARVSSGSCRVPGLVSSRREELGPYDDDVDVIRFDRKGKEPIEILAVSGHPVVVSEAERESVSADYPGAVCSVLEREGVLPAFFSSALGGVSILFPEFKMDVERHLELLCELISTGRKRAIAGATRVKRQCLASKVVRVKKTMSTPGMFSPLGMPWSLGDTALRPLLEKLSKTFADIMHFDEGIPIHLVELGDTLIAGTPFDLGVTVKQELKSSAESAGYRHCLVVSQADAYAGYVHMSDVYRKKPTKGYRFMAFYENALAPFGFDLGDRVVSAVNECIPLPDRLST